MAALEYAVAKRDGHTIVTIPELPNGDQANFIISQHSEAVLIVICLSAALGQLRAVLEKYQAGVIAVIFEASYGDAKATKGSKDEALKWVMGVMDKPRMEVVEDCPLDDEPVLEGDSDTEGLFRLEC